MSFISKRKGSREKQRSETNTGKYDTGKLSVVDGKTETNESVDDL